MISRFLRCTVRRQMKERCNQGTGGSGTDLVPDSPDTDGKQLLLETVGPAQPARNTRTSTLRFCSRSALVLLEPTGPTPRIDIRISATPLLTRYRCTANALSLIHISEPT